MQGGQELAYRMLMFCCTYLVNEEADQQLTLRELLLERTRSTI